jgi:hypothetical protein
MDNILVLTFGLKVDGVIQLLIHLRIILKIYFQKFIEKAGMILAHYPENNQLGNGLLNGNIRLMNLIN